MTTYSTHIPLLVRTLTQTRGPILEFGVGWYSTPIIHAFAAEGRYARSLEDNPEWLARFMHFNDGTNHDVRLTPEWDDRHLLDNRWSVALIDHRNSRRLPDLLRIRHHANFILIHDTETQSYCLDEVLPTFPFIGHTKLLPRTTIVSDLFPVATMLEGLDYEPAKA